MCFAMAAEYWDRLITYLISDGWGQILRKVYKGNPKSLKYDK